MFRHKSLEERAERIARRREEETAYLANMLKAARTWVVKHESLLERLGIELLAEYKHELEFHKKTGFTRASIDTCRRRVIMSGAGSIPIEARWRETPEKLAERVLWAVIRYLA